MTTAKPDTGKRAPLSRHPFKPDPVTPSECAWCGRRREAHPKK